MSVCPLGVVTLCALGFLGSTLGIELGFEGMEIVKLGIDLHEERIKRRAVAVIPALVNINEIPVVVAPGDLAVGSGDDEVRDVRAVEQDLVAAAHYPAVALSGLESR